MMLVVTAASSFSGLRSRTQRLPVCPVLLLLQQCCPTHQLVLRSSGVPRAPPLPDRPLSPPAAQRTFTSSCCTQYARYLHRYRCRPTYLIVDLHGLHEASRVFSRLLAGLRRDVYVFFVTRRQQNLTRGRANTSQRAWILSCMSFPRGGTWNHY